ncbi:MAG: hypothetical protein JXX29_20625 [Deltaproteobacteria bacterium]|nr:hypothetical protein [Deltaproteobacteria bacterium]MBN2674098.1 hypothetical protein [Deltaproteobacteria bacterium]
MYLFLARRPVVNFANGIITTVAALIIGGCSAREATCINDLNDEHRNCEYFNSMPSSCHSDGAPYPFLSNCHQVEYCTDYSAVDSSVSADTATDSNASVDTDSSMDSAFDTEPDSQTIQDTESDTGALTGIVCKTVCEGELIDCEELGNQTECERNRHCSWYAEANTI